MRLLVLGGTVFVGRHAVLAALAAGHDVTLFHRGKHPLDAGLAAAGAAGPGRLSEVHGDRRADLDRLADGSWDAVLDTSCYTPGEMTLAANALAHRVERYLLVSSISAYASFATIGMTEEAPLASLSDADRRDAESLDREDSAQQARFFELYGALKAACEAELQRIAGVRALIVRPGLIVGPDDPTDRFTYWPDRVARGGDVLLPGRPERQVQFIDVRDLGQWMVRLLEGGRRDVFHATGPLDPTGMGAVFEAARRASGADARPVWVDEAFLLAQNVRPWMDLPLWIPESALDSAGLEQMDIRRAVAAGLTFRRLEQTMRDTLAWSRTRAPGPRKAGLTPERERELLERWAATG